MAESEPWNRPSECGRAAPDWSSHGTPGGVGASRDPQGADTGAGGKGMTDSEQGGGNLLSLWGHARLSVTGLEAVCSVERTTDTVTDTPQ